MDATNFFDNTLQLFKQADEFINNVINQYIVRPTGSVNSQGVGGFVFDIVGQEEMAFDSDITDHFVEDNFAIQDHIARRPERFTLRGYVGELKDLLPFAGVVLLQKIQTLASLGAYQSEWAVQAAQVYSQIANQVSHAANVLNQAQSVYKVFLAGDTSATRQQSVFKYFYTLWASRMLCDIETPWQTFTGMAIESVRVIQREESRYVSDFAVTFKQIRIANTAVTMKSGVGGPLASQASETPFLTNSSLIPKAWDGLATDVTSQIVNLGSEQGLQTAVDTLLNLSDSLQPIQPSQ